MSTQWFFEIPQCLLLGSVLTWFLVAPQTFAQMGLPTDVAALEHGHQHSGPVAHAWEGSSEGIAYSERNHHVAGLMVMLMGLAEVSHVMRVSSLGWARLLLPSAMLLSGLFVMIWSDHDAWPIGSLSFSDTFFGHDHEIIQHKIYGFMALGVGSVELCRRMGRMGHRVWASPLPLMAVIGGLLLFGHSHGDHPGAQAIAMHHAMMGTMAVTAGSSKLFSNWFYPDDEQGTRKWEWLWAGLILLIGADLFLYSE
jgi:hypothetical protein